MQTDSGNTEPSPNLTPTPPPEMNNKRYNIKVLKSNFNFSLAHLATFILIFGVIGSYLIVSSFAASPNGPPAAESSSVVPGQLLIRFKPSVTKAQRDEAFKDNNLTEVKEIPQIGVKVVKVPVNAADAVRTALAHNPAIDFAEQDQIAKPQAIMPNDPYFPDSSGVRYSLGQGENWGWGSKFTHTVDVWDITQGDPSVQIAILDTGIETAGLSDFDGQISSTWNVMNNTSDATTNATQHGTYVAGVAGLAINNGVGSAGFCPKCKLMIVQVGTDKGATDSDLAAGLAYAADHGAKIANMSFAGTSNSSTLSNATTYAHNKGVMIFAAAGNSDNSTPNYPAADPYVLGVAGYNTSFNKAGDSNYGSWVAFAAPEGNMTAWPLINGSPGYGSVGGTSVASPAAAGMAGLVWSKNPAMSEAQVEQTLKSTASAATFTVAYGNIMPMAALQSLGYIDPQASSLPVQTSPAQTYYEQLVKCNQYCVSSLGSTSPQPGMALAGSAGAWTGSSGLIISSIAWQKCSSGGTCTSVPGGLIHGVQPEEVGYALKETFTIKNSVGTASDSVLTPIVAPAPAGDTTPPTVSISTPVNGATVPSPTGIDVKAPDNTATAANTGIARVEYYMDGKIFDTAYQTQNGSDTFFAWLPSYLTACSSHTLAARAVDTSGNATTSSPVSVTISGTCSTDTTKPTVSMAAPTNGSTVSGATTVSANASDNVGVASVQFQLDGSNLGSAITASPYSSSWNTTTATNGTHTLTAVAKDAAGNTTTSSPINVTVSNTTPATTPSAPTLNTPTAGNGSASLTWTTPSSNGGSSITGYKVYRGTASGGETLLTTLGNVTSFSDSGLASSTTYYYQVSAVNAVGEGSKSAEQSVKTLDSVPPSASMTSPTANSSVSGIISVSANASDNVAVAKVVFTLDGSATLATVTTSPYNTSWNTTTVANGTHTIVATAYDTSNNTNTSSVTFTVANADTTPPSVSLTDPAAGSAVSGGVAISANASDNINVSKVVFSIDGSAVSTDTSSPYSFSWDSTTVSNGTHSISATAYDTSNNQTTVSESVTVSNADTQPPTTPTNLSASVPAYNQANLSWTASTDNIGVAGYYIVRNGTTIAQKAGIGTTYTDSTVTASTSYNFQVMAYDAAGNISPLSNIASVTTPSVPDTQPPSQPTNLVATAVSSSQINLSWTAATDNIGVTLYDVYRNSTKITSVTGSTTSYGNFGLSASTTYSYYVVARDAAGNSSLGSNTASATTQPSVTTGSISGQVTSAANGGAISGATVSLTIGGRHSSSTFSTSTDSNGNYSLTSLTAGSYSAKYSYTGYNSYTTTANISGGSNTTLNANLSDCTSKRCK